MEKHLLFRAENRVGGRLRDSEFDNGLGRNLDLLLRLGIKARARLSFLLHQFAKPGQYVFSILFDSFVGDGAERIKECAGCLSIGLNSFGKCGLKSCFGHFKKIRSSFIAREAHRFNTIRGCVRDFGAGFPAEASERFFGHARKLGPKLIGVLLMACQ
jgi:hypothetical protein